MEKSKYQIIQEWNELVKEGVITEIEFEIKKQALLGNTKIPKPEQGMKSNEKKDNDSLIKKINSKELKNNEKENNWLAVNRFWVILIISLLVIAYGVYYMNYKPNNETQIETDFSSISIDTIKIDEYKQKNICFVSQYSEYPIIKGIKDETFQKEINELLSSNYTHHVDSAKLLSGGCPSGVDSCEDYQLGLTSSSFSILNNKNNIVSIIQYYLSSPFNDQHGYEIKSSVLNCDVKRNKILKTSDLGIKYINIDLINNSIVTYFDKNFPNHIGSFDNLAIKSESDFNKLNFGIKNDSIMLIMEAYPVAHNSYHTYIIPIDKIKN